MKTLLGITIPDLSTLGPVELKALRTALRDAGKAVLAAGDVPVDKLAEMKEADKLANLSTGEITLAIAEREKAQADFDAEAAALAAAFADDADDEAELTAEQLAELAPLEGLSDEDIASLAELEGLTPEQLAELAPDAVTASARWTPTAAQVAAGAPVGRPAPAGRPARTGAYSDAGFTAVGSGTEGVDVGEAFTSGKSMGQALTERWGSIAGGSGDKVVVARAHGHFSDAQKLSESAEENYAKFGGLDPLSPQSQAIVAALCAPTEPLYDLATTSSTARPVKASLATYNPMRGKVSVHPSPKLADIDDGPGGNGRGVWTAANDADINAVKEACARIACADSETYTIYGVYRCMTIKNMLAMTFPELVDAYLNRLGALTARLAEETLLDAMYASVNTKAVTVEKANDFGAGINLWSTLENLSAVYREEERYGDEQVFDTWLPRWAKSQLKIDYMRQRRTSGPLSDRIISDAEINAAFRGLGHNVTWTMDNAATWESVTPTGDDGDPLPALPTTLDFIMTPRGNLRALDKGELNIGVTNNNIYRDNASNAKNEFTIFQESFEGLLDFGAQSWGVTIPDFCPNGAQTLDVAAIECSAS